MANVTLAIDDDLLRLARVKAVQQGTTVNAVVRGWLDEWVHDDAQGATVDTLLALAKDVGGSNVTPSWRREDLYDR